MPVKHELIRGYAEALFSVAEAEGVLAEVEDELFQFTKVVESDVALRESLTDIAIPAERKRALLQDLLGTRANPQTVNESTRPRIFVEIEPEHGNPLIQDADVGDCL